MDDLNDILQSGRIVTSKLRSRAFKANKAEGQLRRVAKRGGRERRETRLTPDNLQQQLNLPLILQATLQELPDQVVHQHARDDLEVIQFGEQGDEITRFFSERFLLLRRGRGGERVEVGGEGLDEGLDEACSCEGEKEKVRNEEL